MKMKLDSCRQFVHNKKYDVLKKMMSPQIDIGWMRTVLCFSEIEIGLMPIYMYIYLLQA